MYQLKIFNGRGEISDSPPFLIVTYSISGTADCCPVCVTERHVQHLSQFEYHHRGRIMKRCQAYLFDPLLRT